MIQCYVTNVDRLNKKVEITMYTNESKEHLFFLKKYRNLYQGKGLTHDTNPPENIYEYFRKALKGVARNTWYVNISKDKKTQYNLDKTPSIILKTKIF